MVSILDLALNSLSTVAQTLSIVIMGTIWVTRFSFFCAFAHHCMVMAGMSTSRTSLELKNERGPHSRFATRRTGMLKRAEMTKILLAIASLIVATCTLFANGGAWQTGVPGTGSASASNSDKQTNVTIQNEALKIDLHPEYAAVDVRDRMHNTGSKVQQDFYFPVERWGKNPDSDNEGKSDDIDRYQISVDGKELKSTNVAGPKQETSKKKEGTSEANQESSETKEEDS